MLYACQLVHTDIHEVAWMFSKNLLSSGVSVRTLGNATERLLINLKKNERIPQPYCWALTEVFHNLIIDLQNHVIHHHKNGYNAFSS